MPDGLHWSCTPRVAGSSPAAAPRRGVAQLVEQV